jgi:methylaspartate mutase epsilon subunit
VSFGESVRRRHAAGALVVQPRMGLADPARMRRGLAAVKAAAATTAGTITLDSYTRIGDLESVDRALRDGVELNGYPIVTHGADATRRMVEGIADDDFPIQVRHGSARPSRIVEAMSRAGLHATEGGPVSYCLPYGRTPLDESLRDWTRACEILVESCEPGVQPHLETFGGCMMGQLCPPSLLVALSVLEALFFRSMRLRSVSVSYAQQTNAAQDREAVRALRRLCTELLSDIEWHVVVYAYMGLYPRTAPGARALLADAARLAVDTGSERLIVKTVAEAFRLPTVEENVEALELAAAVAAEHRGSPLPPDEDHGQLYEEARALVDAVLNIGSDVGRSLVAAFGLGLLDVPYCLHPDNAGRARSRLDADGRLRWAALGSLPLRHLVGRDRDDIPTASRLVAALSHVQRSFDATAAGRLANNDDGALAADDRPAVKQMKELP